MTIIVLGARGLGGRERVLLGSVSLGIARDAPCAPPPPAARS
jgi:nucleotide-binding universal stress UspA family protein